MLATALSQPTAALDDPERLSASFRLCRYRAFGARVDIGGMTPAPARNDPSFQNRTFDAGLGIYDYRNRQLRPGHGELAERWASAHRSVAGKLLEKSG